jgi:transglutaminase-like putative cysteine protease
MPFRSFILMFALAVCTEISGLAQHLEVTGRHRIVLTYDYVGNGEDPGKFYLPIPPNTGCQTIESFHSNWTGETITNDASPAQHLLAGRVPSGSRVHWRVQIVGTFTTHELVEGAAGALPSHPPRVDLFEGTSESLDWKSDPFQDWLDGRRLRRQANESAVTYGHRLYNYIVAHGDYSYPPEGGWTASRAARYLSSDCGGFSLVFVSACRANHIPARLLVGQWFKTVGHSNGSLELAGRQAHVIAEFYDPLIGWIPVDIASALMRIGGRDDYFGREPGYFFAWHFDTDFHFDVPGGSNGHVQWIQNPSPWFAGGEADDSSHRWTVELQ